MNTNLNTNTSVISEEAFGDNIASSLTEVYDAIKEQDNQTETMEKEMNNETKLPKTRLFLTELNKLLVEFTVEPVDLRKYIKSPTQINILASKAGAIVRVKRRQHVVELLHSAWQSINRVIEKLDHNDMIFAEDVLSGLNLIVLMDYLTPEAIEMLPNLGEAQAEFKAWVDENTSSEAPRELEASVPEIEAVPTQESNSIGNRFNQVTDIHRAVEANFKQHEQYFGGYGDDDLVDLVSKGYLLGRDLNDFLGVVIDKEDTLPNGITLLELIIINNNLAFIADLAAKDSPIRSFELYVWNVNKLLPEVVAGEVDVLQRTLNSLKGLAERLHSRAGIAANLNSLFGFGLDVGLDARGSRSNGDRDEYRGRGVRDRARSTYREDDCRDREEERYTRQTGRRGRYSR